MILVIYISIMILKKFLNMIEFFSQLFEVQIVMNVGFLNLNLIEFCLEIRNV